MTTQRDNRLNSKTISGGCNERPRSDAQTCISTRELFQQSREVLIDHEGQIYRLRLTQQNKLILNK
ncbi:MAG: hemin uptake protein HemP [Steroidobacteraceae bacterium]